MTVEPAGPDELARDEVRRRVADGDLALVRVVGSVADEADPCGLRQAALSRRIAAGVGVAAGLTLGGVVLAGVLAAVGAVEFGAAAFLSCQAIGAVGALVMVLRAKAGAGLGLRRDVARTVAARQAAVDHGFELVVPARPGDALAEAGRPVPRGLIVGALSAALGSPSSRIRVPGAVVCGSGRPCEAGNALTEYRQYNASGYVWAQAGRQRYVMMALDRPTPDVVLKRRRAPLPSLRLRSAAALRDGPFARTAVDPGFDEAFATYAVDPDAARAFLTPQLRQGLLASPPGTHLQFKGAVVVFFRIGRLDFASEATWDVIKRLRDLVETIAPLTTEYVDSATIPIPDGTEPPYTPYPRTS